MKNKLLTAIAFFALFACHQNCPIHDTESAEVDSLLKVYRELIQTDPTGTMILIRNKQQALADSVNYYWLNTLVGVGYFMRNQTDSAIATNKSVIGFCQRANRTDPGLWEMEAKACNDIGVFLQIAGQKDSAILYQQKAIEHITRSGKVQSLPDIYINMADNYNHKGDFPAAANQYRKAMFIADSLNLDDKFPPIYTGLAQVYTYLKNYKEADRYFNKIEAVFDTLPAFDRYFFANSRGNYYYTTREYEKGLFWVKKANQAAGIFAQPDYSATTEANLGELFLLLGRPDSAKHYLDKAAVYFLAEHAPETGRYGLNGMYAAYFLHNNDLEKAAEYLSFSYDMGRVNPYYVYANDLRREELYRRRGDYRKAYELAKKTGLYDDSVRNITIQNQIAEIDSRYRQDTILLKRDIELAGKERKVLQLQKTSIFIVSLSGVSAFVLIVIAIYRRKKRELQQVRQMSTITRLRMESIRNRISPHFMFNVLNSVVPSLRKYRDLARPMQLLVESIRDNLLISGKMAISLGEEIGIVKNYLALLESIGNEGPQVTWEVDDDVDLETLIPSMVIQIPVENAIKYAFEGRSSDKRLSIKITSGESNFLFITIRDNGIGFDPGRHRRDNKGTGTGLNILYKTIEMLNVVNQEKMEFEIKNEVNISSDRHGTGVLIKIPLKYRYEL